MSDGIKSLNVMIASRDDTSDILGRSRTCSLIDRKVEKDILIKSLQVKRAQRKYEEERIELEIMKIDAKAGIGGFSVGTSSRSNRSSSSVSSSTLCRSSLARSETTRRRRHHDPRSPEKSGTMVERNSRLGSHIAEVS
jgi:hypothetical protein